MDFAQCYLGETLQLECHKDWFTKKRALLEWDSISEEEQSVISARTGIVLNKSVCLHHKLMFGSCYASRQRYCCDPFFCHQKKVKSGLREISLAFSKSISPLSLIPGKKLCVNCLTAVTGNSHNPPSFPTSPSNLASDNAQNNWCDVDADSGSHTGQEPEKDLEAFTQLMASIRAKLSTTTSYNDRISLLTLAPPHWSRLDVCHFFGVTDYMARKARELRESKGILGQREGRPGRSVDDEVRQSIVHIYEDEEFNRVCAGTSEFVSMRLPNGEKVQQQKRLLLVNLRELFLSWKESREGKSACGFSLFASLRPKWCVLAGASGRFVVCKK